MKTVKALIAATVATVLSVAGTASAGTLTSYFPIANLDATTGTSEGYRVYALSYTLPNPANCANTDYAEMYPSMTAAERDLMNKTLLAAFLAGKQIRLIIASTSCSVNNRPAYYLVRVDYAG